MKTRSRGGTDHGVGFGGGEQREGAPLGRVGPTKAGGGRAAPSL